jgi:hypothetical protein
VAVLEGLTLHHQPDATPKEQKQEVKRAVDKPEAHVDGTTIRTAEGSPFAIEVLVRGADGKYTPRTPEKKENGQLAFVGLDRNDVYAVRLINDAAFEAAVSLHVDGLSMFAFSEKDPSTGRPRFGQLLVPGGGKSVLVEGWHLKGNEWDRFKVVGYGEKIQDKPEDNAASIGQITASFHAAWKKGGAPPAGEPKENSQGVRTTRGERYYQEIEPAEREVGLLRAAVTVRYSR